MNQQVPTHRRLTCNNPVWDEVIERDNANIPDWYAPHAQGLLRLSPQHLSYIIGRPVHRRPNGWAKHNPGVFFKWVGDHVLWVVEIEDRGWVVERNELFSPDDQILGNWLGPLLALIPNLATAAHLAEVCYPRPDPQSLLAWL